MVRTTAKEMMLVLSRQRDESIMVGDDLLVTVRAIRGESVCLCINRRLPAGQFAGGRFAADTGETWLQRDDVLWLLPDAWCEVVDIRDDKVRLGFNVPKELSVHRKEVYDAIRRENDERDGGEALGSPVPR
jgi:sRNA-binding carbon storage regulator CsrA